MEPTKTPKTMSVPDAGREYFGLSRNASYEAARRGQLPVIKIGKLLRVPIAALELMLTGYEVMEEERNRRSGRN